MRIDEQHIDLRLEGFGFVQAAVDRATHVWACQAWQQSCQRFENAELPDFGPIRRAQAKLGDKPLEQHILTSLVAKGVWAAESLSALAEVPSHCEFCGGPGTVAHRLWEWPHWAWLIGSLLRPSTLEWIRAQSFVCRTYLHWRGAPREHHLEGTTYLDAFDHANKITVYSDGSVLHSNRKESL
eukprot:464262-Amphidinium_carterae.1